MRWSVLLVLALAACGDSRESSFLVAIRPIDGDWQIVDARCGPPIATPVDLPYELAIIEYGTWGKRVRLLQAGPEDKVHQFDGWRGGAWSPCPWRPYTEINLQVVGAPGAEVSVKRGAGSTPGPLFVTELGMQDLVANSFDPDNRVAPYFVIQRGLDVTRDGVTLDFTGADRTVAVAAAIQGSDGLVSAQPVTFLSTAGGTVHYLPQGWAIPSTALAADDLEALSLTSPKPELTGGGHVILDLRDRSGTVVATMPPPVDTASGTIDGARVTLEATTSLMWNELFVRLEEASPYTDQEMGSSWTVERRRGWPETGFDLPDVAAIPGWRDEWNIVGPHEGYLELCEHVASDRRCAGAYWSGE